MNVCVRYGGVPSLHVSCKHMCMDVGVGEHRCENTNVRACGCV